MEQKEIIFSDNDIVGKLSQQTKKPAVNHDRIEILHDRMEILMVRFAEMERSNAEMKRDNAEMERNNKEAFAAQAEINRQIFAAQAETDRKIERWQEEVRKDFREIEKLLATRKSRQDKDIHTQLKEESLAQITTVAVDKQISTIATIPQATLSENKKEGEDLLKNKQQEALSDLYKLIQKDIHASTGISQMNKLFDEYGFTDKGSHSIPLDKLLSDLKTCARKRTLGFFSSFSSLSLTVEQGIQRFFSVGRKEWVNDLYSALNKMNDPNKVDDVEKLLTSLKGIANSKILNTNSSNQCKYC